MEKTMTLGQITEILDKAQIRYNRKLSHIYGSEYWDIGGIGYRLSDHPKSEWRQSENIEIPLYKNNYQPLYDQLISRKDIDLKDKTEYENEYIKLAKKLIFPREKDGLLKTPDGNLYDNNEQGLNNAAKGMWNRKVYFPIQNKELNNYVKKEALKKELDNAYENGAKEEIDTIKKQLAEVETFKDGGKIKSNGIFKSLGSSKELGITPNISGHDMIAKCDCGEKFSYQNSKKNILWQCPECNGMKRIKTS